MFTNQLFNSLVKTYRENKLAHAYLFETNNSKLLIEDLKKLIKILNCPHEYQEECSKCNLCNLINKDSLPSLKIIEPDGTMIKKAQMEELQKNFLTKPVYSRFNIYIIKNAEKFNSSSANSMLKFIEEPAPGIIGFFITDNKEVIIDTIKSRCQAYVINYNNDMIEKLNITATEYDNYTKTIKTYLRKIADCDYINNKTEIINVYPEKKDIENIFEIILAVHYQNFLKRNNKDYDENLISIYEVNDENNKLIRKLNIIANVINNLNYNVSMEQTLDKFVIEMRGNNG